MRRSIGGHVGQLLFVLAVIGVAAARGAATTFVLMDERALAARSVAAVLGTVSSVRSEMAAGGAVVTRIAIEPEQVMLGALPPGRVTVQERGGTVGSRSERIFGSAEYRVGERVLAFLSRGPDGALHTTAMAMGKFHVDAEAADDVRVSRSVGSEAALLDPLTGTLRPGGPVDSERLATLVGRLRGLAPSAAATTRPRDLGAAPRHPAAGAAAFTYLGAPSRWFEPDAGMPIRFRIDASGDATVGADAAIGAALDALAAWSDVQGSSLRLVDGVLAAPLPFAGCDGDSRVVFNDPFGEIDPPSGCAGVLGIGGFCTTDETRAVDEVNFRRIGLGKVTLADGFAGCPFWNACNVAEVITHEIGHAIGLGHSQDATATMNATARFDGRCAGLAADDIDGLRTIYPEAVWVGTPSFTPTASPTAPRRSSTPTPSPTRRPVTPTVHPTLRPGSPRTVSGRITYADSQLPVAGVTVELRGATPQHRITGTDGRFVFSGVADGRWVIEPRTDGDVGGAISALDAAWVLQAAAGLRTLSPAQRVACDVTGNGVASPLDAARILQRKVGEIDYFPASDLCGSEWFFVPSPAPLAGQDIVAPGIHSADCQHGALMLNRLPGNADDQDFQAVILGDCTGSWQSEATSTAEIRRAPPGTALEMLPLRRRPGGRWLQPIAVRAPAAVHALDLELHYDAARLRFRRIRPVSLAEPNLVLARSAQPGRITIGVASALPLPSGTALIVVEFSSTQPTISPHQIRAFSAALDERVVPTPAP